MASYLSDDLFRQNLNALRQHRPHLAALVETAQPDATRYRIIPSKKEQPSLEVTGQDGVTRLWHSRYDPLLEAQRELDAIDHSIPYVPFFAGVGLGYAVRLLADQRPSDFFDLILLEENAAIFRLAMSAVRLDDLFANPRVYIQIGDDIELWREIVLAALPGIMSCRLQVIQRRAAIESAPEYYQTLLGILKQRLQLAEAEFDLMIRSGRKIQENLWRNLPAIARSTGIDRARGAWRGKPAIVVAAGPSLDKNADHLAAAQESCLLIVVDTALRTVLSRGAAPHLVVSTDPSELNLKHFEGVSPPPEIILAFDPELYWGVPHQWLGRLLYANLEKSAFTRWVERVCGPYGFMAKGISVGHTAFYLARELGADPIILVGLDLAFDPAGGKTHVSDAALHRDYSAIPAGVKLLELSERYGSGPMVEGIVWVPGALGGEVPTSEVMALYLRQFGDDVRQTAARVIDATEGGARIEGAEIMPLRDALHQVSPYGLSPSETLVQLTAIPHGFERLQRETSIIVEALEASGVIAERGLELVQALLPRSDQGAALRHDPTWGEMEARFNEIHHRDEIKIALEQAMFGAVYQFIRKEHLSQSAVRLEKYRRYFEAFLREREALAPVIQPPR